MYRTDFWTQWEKARVGCFKRTALKHVYYLGWNRSPAQVGCMKTSSRGWFTGKIQRDRVEKEVGGGIGVGNTYKSERVTGRKVRGLQTEEIGCKCQTFFSLLSGRRKQTSNIFFLLYTNSKGVSLKMLCCHDTRFHLKLTLLKPWVNQYISFSYGNVCLKIC